MKLSDFERYKSEEQRERWSRLSSTLSKEEKRKLLDECIDYKDPYAYYSLMSELLFELVSKSDDYLNLFTRIAKKYKEGVAHAPIQPLLEKLGKETEQAGFLRESFKSSTDEGQRIASGRILGGMGIKDQDTILDIIHKELGECNDSALLQSYVMALLIIIVETKIIKKKTYEAINKLLEKGDENTDKHIISLAISSYAGNPMYFYGVITNLLDKNLELYGSTLLWEISYKRVLESERFIEVVERMKDCSPEALQHVYGSLPRYPEEKEAIIDLCYYWMNSGLYFRLRNLDWALEELMKKDSSFLSSFIRKYKKAKNHGALLVNVPHLFGRLAHINPELALSEAIRINPKPGEWYDIEKAFKFKVLTEFLGCFYNDPIKFPLMKELAKHLIGIVEEEGEDYITDPNFGKSLSAKELSKEKYDVFIDKLNLLLNELQERKEPNYELIEKTVANSQILNKCVKKVVEYCKNNKRYAPLLWILERSSGDSIDRSAIAYLEEIKGGLEIFLDVENQKYPNEKDKLKRIYDCLKNTQEFWGFFSELIIMSRLSSTIKTKDLKLGNQKDFDFKCLLDGKLIILEATSLRPNRDFMISNKAIGMNNQSYSKINDKMGDLIKSGIKLNPEYEKAYPYVILDLSRSMIDEYDVLNSLFGTLAVSWKVDKKGGKIGEIETIRLRDSIGEKKAESSLLGGVIYFNYSVRDTTEGNPRLILSGNLINNPYSKHSLGEEDLEKLKRMIFR